MSQETEKSDILALCDRVKELDGKATKKPWIAELLPNGQMAIKSDWQYLATIWHPKIERNETYFHDYEKHEGNKDLIAEFRTAAPRLAEMVRIAVEALEKTSNGMPRGFHITEQAAMRDCARTALTRMAEVKGEK